MRRIAATLAVVGALLFSAGAAWADYDNGLAAAQRGDFATALQEIRPLAEQGDAEAQYWFCIMYREDWAGPKNNAEAVKWCRKAAEQGLAAAPYRNNAKAMEWYRKAAEQGHPSAYTSIGLMYQRGAGVPVNYIKAYMWLSLSKALGNSWLGDWLNRLSKQMTLSQIATAQELTAEMWEKINN